LINAKKILSETKKELLRNVVDIKSGDTYRYYGNGYRNGADPEPCWPWVGVLYDWQKWIKDDITDGLVCNVWDASSLAVVSECKGKYDKGKFYLWVNLGFNTRQENERLPAIRKILMELKISPLDGVTFHETMTFEYGSGKLWELSGMA